MTQRQDKRQQDITYETHKTLTNSKILLSLSFSPFLKDILFNLNDC